MKKKEPKMFNLGGKEDDAISWSLMRGHVSKKLFRKTFQADWKADDLPDEDIKYDYWKQLKSGAWRGSEPGAKGAVRVTVTDW